MLSSERIVDAAHILARHESWIAVELELTAEKIDWLWSEVQKFRSLFSDLTRGNRDNFVQVLIDPNSYWVEIVEEGTYHSDDQIVGIMYLTGVNQVIDADIHMMFFDRKPAEKAPLAKAIIEHMFAKFTGLHRMTATMPTIYHSTQRLAKKLGFVHEGTKRQSQLMQGRYQNEVILGLLASEVANGLNN